MSIEKTELEWPYSPADFFEVPYHRQNGDYTLVADAGMVRVTLTTPADPVDPGLQARISADVQGLFQLRQLQMHRSFRLESPRTYQHRSGGGKSISIGLVYDTVRISDGPVDLVLRDEFGAIVQDTKAQRIADHTSFIDSVMPKLASSPPLRALLQSYNAAVEDPANELVHLYEIRDALAKHYGGKDAACAALGISKNEWDRLGILANALPLEQGRHRGKHVLAKRPASADELNEARALVRRWISTFANHI